MANAINSLNFGGNTYTFTLPYGVCSTAGDVAEKVVTVPNFSIENGARILVRFDNTNTSQYPTLNVNGSGAIPIALGDMTDFTSNNIHIDANRSYEFVLNISEADSSLRTTWDLLHADVNAPLMVNFTLNSDSESCTVDKTFAEVYAAAVAGRPVFAAYEGAEQYYLTLCTSRQIEFSSANRKGEIFALILRDDESAFFRSKELVSLDGGTMTGALTLSGDPTSDLHAATKQYVDAKATWEALPDKPFSTIKTAFLTETTLDFADDGSGMGVYMGVYDGLTVSAGTHCLVTWDGVEYSCLAFTDSDGFVYVGNMSILGGEDTGEPFLFVCVDQPPYMNIGTKSTDVTHAVKVDVLDGRIPEGFLPESALVQSDYNQNDSTAADYIKNRPFHGEATVVLSESTLTFLYDDEGYYYDNGHVTDAIVLTSGHKYQLVFDGIAYVGIAESVKIGTITWIGFGNKSIMDSSLANTGEPFFCGYYAGQAFTQVATKIAGDTHNVEIYDITDLVTIDEKYLPSTVATKQYADSRVFTAVYGTTTLEEVKAAYNSGATVLCTRNDNSVKYILTGLTDTTAYFMGMGTSSQILYRVYLDTTWHAASFTCAASAHNQAASTVTAGTFAGQVVANSSGQTYSTSLLRNSKLVSAETNPTVNGEICWTYE